MPFHVQRQVIRAGKAALADLTLEGLCAGVLAVVAGELIGTGKTPLALGPLTAVRLLAWERKGQKGEKRESRRVRSCVL